MSNMVSAAIRKAKVEEEQEKRNKILEPVKVVADFVAPIASRIIGNKGKSDSQDRINYVTNYVTKRERPNDPKFYTWTLDKFSNYVDKIRTFRIKTHGFVLTNSGQESNEFGILALDWTPTLGGVGTNQPGLTAPIEFAMNDLFAKVRAANAGSSNNITKATQMLYVLAVDQIITHLTQVKRFLRCCKTYYNTNRYSGRALAAASLYYNLTVVDDAIKNYSNYCARLNYLIAQFNNSVNVPNLFSMIQVRATMANDIYADSVSEQCNYMLYRTLTLFKINDNGDGLDTSNLSGTLSDYLDNIEDAISRLLILEPFNIVNGDFLKAFGSENMVQIPVFNSNEEQEIIYSDEINERINNTTVVPLFAGIGVKSTIDGNSLYQGTLSNPYLMTTGTAGSAESLQSVESQFISKLPINSDKPIDAITAEDVISMTRHTVLPWARTSEPTPGSFTNYGFYACLGSEVIHGMYVYNVQEVGAQLSLAISMLTPGTFSNVNTFKTSLVQAIGTFEVFPMIFSISSFFNTGLTDWHYFAATTASNNITVVKGRNKFMLDSEVLENLHLIALTSEFSLHQPVATGRDIVYQGKQRSNKSKEK